MKLLMEARAMFLAQQSYKRAADAILKGREFRMPVLAVLCDRCFVSSGLTEPMSATASLEIRENQHELHAPLGDSYRCNCGRWYSVLGGYFNFTEGVGPTNTRTGPRCARPQHTEEFIMYLQSGDRATRQGYFACPRCSQTKEGALE